MHAVVADAADDRALFDFEDDVLVIDAVGRIFDAELYVFEKLRVPQSLEIAAERFFVVGVAFARKDARFQGVAANPAIACRSSGIPSPD